MMVLWWGHFLWFWGLTSANEWPYLLWSGSGSDLTRLAIAGIGLMIVRQRSQHHRELKDMHERHHRELMGGNENA
jgi:hypothetical protein